MIRVITDLNSIELERLTMWLDKGYEILELNDTAINKVDNDTLKMYKLLLTYSEG